MKLTAPRLLSTTILAAAAFPLASVAQLPLPSVTTATQAINPASRVLATDLGPLPASQHLTVRLGLQLQNKSALLAYVADVNNPSSANYGQSLTPAQFAASYAPSAAQVQQVVGFLQSAGFSNITIEPNNLIVSADGSADRVSATFNTPLELFSQFGKTVYGNLAAPQVPASLSGIVGAVLGLNTIGSWHTNIALPSQLPQYLVSYTPAQLTHIYGGDNVTTGSRTQIAIMAEGNVAGVVTDLRKAEALFNLPQVPVQIHQVGLASPDTSGLDEWDMDTQYSTGMAYNVAKLHIYTTTSLSDSDLALEISRWATDNVAKAASASLGICEVFPYTDGSMLVDDNSFLEAAAQGQTFFASSGDTGSFCPVGANTNGVPAGVPLVQYPAASTYVVGVGGTTLLPDSSGNYNTEISWNAGGGGFSQFEGSPFWQQAAYLPAKQGNLRAVPDIAYDADPESGASVVVNGTPTGVGGTSLSSPMALGTWARVLTRNPRAGYGPLAFYSLYDGSGVVGVYPVGGFHDITVGGNGLYTAAPGYDLNTGLGTPWISQLVQALAH